MPRRNKATTYAAAAAAADDAYADDADDAYAAAAYDDDFKPFASRAYAPKRRVNAEEDEDPYWHDYSDSDWDGERDNSEWWEQYDYRDEIQAELEEIRIVAVSKIIRAWRRHRLVQVVQAAWLEYSYAPGGPGYNRAQGDWERNSGLA